MRGKVRGSKTKRATAYHEAGHAVMAWHEGIRVKWASIIPTGEYRGAVQHADLFRRGTDPGGGGIIPPRVRARIEKGARIAIAGRVAQRLGCPGTRLRGGHPDLQQAYDTLSHLCGPADEIAAYWRLLEIQAKQTLASPHVWPLVKAVAVALLRQERLSGAELLAVIQEATRKELDRLRQKHAVGKANK